MYSTYETLIDILVANPEYEEFDMMAWDSDNPETDDDAELRYIDSAKNMRDKFPLEFVSFVDEDSKEIWFKKPFYEFYPF